MGRTPTCFDPAEVGHKRPSKEWPTPELEYVYSPEPLTLKQLAERWKGVPGHTLSSLEKRSMGSDPTWSERRAKVQDEIRRRTEEKLLQKISEEMSQGIFDANVRHRRIGLRMQAVATSTLKIVDDGNTVYLIDPKTEKQIPIRASEVIRFFKEGVKVERDALGLADRVVRAQFVREMADRMRIVVEKYVTDSDTYGNIVREFVQIVRVESEALEAYVKENFTEAEEGDG